MCLRLRKFTFFSPRGPCVALLFAGAVVATSACLGNKQAMGHDRENKWATAFSAVAQIVLSKCDFLSLFGLGNDAALFDACLLTGEVAQVIDSCATHTAMLVDFDAVDER